MTKPDVIDMQGLGVAIVAPGGFAPDDAAVARGVALLEAQGCRVKNYYDPDARFLRFGGTDGGRVAQIHQAAQDADIQVVIALRGSYGVSRILPALDFKMLAASGKLFVGHSDITALQMGLLAQAGAMSFAGPMLCDDFSREDISRFTMDHFWQCLTGPRHCISVEAENNPTLKLTGTLWGGNLAMLAHLVGTPYLPQIEGGILFVEDVAEHPFRVERMMLQLLHAGVLARLQAVILGDFSNYRLGAFENGYDFGAMLAYLREYLPVPVLTGLPFGHIRDKVTLAVGAQAELVSDGDGFRITMSGYPGLLQAQRGW